jgi:pSer/pThr/pTyr-binding forkhead associated (FHA) protein
MEDRRRGPRRLLVHVGHTWMPLPVGEWVIGRAPESDIRIDDDRVSRRHGVVRALPSGWELTDGGSLNGIWLDGRQVQRAVIPPAGLTALFGGRDGVPVRLLPDRAGIVPETAGPVGDGDVVEPAPAHGTSPAGVRFEQVTPEWTGWAETGAAPTGWLRSFVRQASRRVTRRDGAR